MSYTSADNFQKIINQGLFTLFNSEFPRESIIYQPEFRIQDLGSKGRYFRIYMDSSEPLESGAQYEARSYNYQMSFYYQYSGDEFKKIFENEITDKWDHFYFYLLGYRSYEPTTGYCWHNIAFNTVSPLIWGFDGENMNVGHIDAEVSIWRTNDLELSDPTIGDQVVVS